MFTTSLLEVHYLQLQLPCNSTVLINDNDMSILHVALVKNINSYFSKMATLYCAPWDTFGTCGTPHFVRRWTAKPKSSDIWQSFMIFFTITINYWQAGSISMYVALKTKSNRHVHFAVCMNLHFTLYVQYVWVSISQLQKMSMTMSNVAKIVCDVRFEQNLDLLSVA